MNSWFSVSITDHVSVYGRWYEYLWNWNGWFPPTQNLNYLSEIAEFAHHQAVPHQCIVSENEVISEIMVFATIAHN